MKKNWFIASGIFSVLLLLGAGCSSNSSENVPRVDEISIASSYCTDLGGDVQKDIDTMSCKFETKVCTKEQLLQHLCFPPFVEGQYAQSKIIRVIDGKIYNFSVERGIILDGALAGKMQIRLDHDILATFQGDPKYLTFWNGMYGGEDRPDSDFDYFFKYKYIEVTTQLQTPYGQGLSTLKKGVSYNCNGPFIVDREFFYCETNKKDFLSQYEKNGAESFVVTTGGDYDPEVDGYWKKMYVRKIGNTDVFFIVNLIDPGTMKANQEDNVEVNRNSKEYLDSLLTLAENKSMIKDVDAFVKSMELSFDTEPHR